MCDSYLLDVVTRMEDEAKELHIKIEALRKFIESPKFDNIKEYHQLLMEQQLNAMREYWRVLVERKDDMIYNLEEFTEINEDELNCIFAESGADREMDFDREKAVKEVYESDKYYKLKRIKGLD